MWRLGNSRVDKREKRGGRVKSLWGREKAELTRKKASRNKSRAGGGGGRGVKLTLGTLGSNDSRDPYTL